MWTHRLPSVYPQTAPSPPAMDYYSDPAFTHYLAQMSDRSPAAERFVSSERDVSRPDRILASADHSYGALGHGANCEEDGIAPRDEGWSPVVAINAEPGGKATGKKRKQPRDPNKPKGWLTANLLYANGHRARVKAENPNASFGDIARLLSAEFKNLSSEETAFWARASADDRARHKLEMLSYTGRSPEFGPTKKKDPNAPKRNLSAWQLYSSGDARKQVLTQFPGSSMKEVMGVLSERYKVLSADKRAVLDSRAAADKTRYDREISVWNEGEYASRCHSMK